MSSIARLVFLLFSCTSNFVFYLCCYNSDEALIVNMRCAQHETCNALKDLNLLVVNVCTNDGKVEEKKNKINETKSQNVIYFSIK